MTSSIDATKPEAGVPASKADLRANLFAAKSEIERLQQVSLNVLDFVPSGTSVSDVIDGTVDATPTFDACGAYIRTLPPSSVYTVVFPPGYYKPTSGYSFVGIPRVKFVGNGATIESPGLVGGASHRIWNTKDPFFITADLENNLRTIDQTLHPGYEISSAAGGQSDVVLTTPSDDSNFSEGSIVFLHGYDTRRSVSTPPSLAYFEWARVESITSGTITLVDPLRHTYRPGWYDYGLSLGEGPAMIIPWEDRLSCIFYEFSGFNIAPKALDTQNNRGNLSPFAMYAHIHDVWAPDSHLNPQVCQNMRVSRCDLYRMEIDKLVDHVLVEDTSMSESDGGSNTSNAEFIRVTWKDNVSLRCRNVVVDNCNIPPGSEFYGYDTGTKRIANSFYGGAPTRAYSTIGATSSFTYTVTNSGGRTTALTFDASALIIKTRCDIGDLLLCQPFSGTGPIYAVITGFDNDGSGNDIVYVESSGEIAANGNIHFTQEREGYDWKNNYPDVSIQNTNLTQPLIAPRISGPGVFTARGTMYDVGLMWGYFRRAIRPKRLSVNVLKAYSGPDTVCRLRFNHDHLDSSWSGTDTGETVDIDLKTAGYREISPTGSTSPIGADANFATFENYFSNSDQIMTGHSLSLNSDLGNFAMTGDSDNTPDRAAMPLIDVRFEYQVLSSSIVNGLVF